MAENRLLGTNQKISGEALAAKRVAGYRVVDNNVKYLPKEKLRERIEDIGVTLDYLRFMRHVYIGYLIDEDWYSTELGDKFWLMEQKHKADVKEIIGDEG